MYVDKVKYLPIIQLSIYISRYEVTYSQFMTLFWKIVFVVIVISSKLEVTWQKTDKNVLHFSTQKTNNIRWQTEPVLGIRSWGSFSRTFLPFKLSTYLKIEINLIYQKISFASMIFNILIWAWSAPGSTNDKIYLPRKLDSVKKYEKMHRKSIVKKIFFFFTIYFHSKFFQCFWSIDFYN